MQIGLGRDGRNVENDLVRKAELTDREQEYVRHLCDGLCDEDIASTMGIALSAVWTYRSRVQRKLDLPDTTAIRLWNSPVSDAVLESVTRVAPRPEAEAAA